MKTRKKLSKEAQEKLGLSLAQVTSTCRCCLSTKRKVFSATLFEDVFKDFTGIEKSPLDGLPKVLCYECTALLQKFDRFRTKVIKSHHILNKYILDKTPIAHDNFEPVLVQTNVMYFNIPAAEVYKFELQTDIVEPDMDMDATKLTAIDVKEETVVTDNEADWCEEDPLNELVDHSNTRKYSASTRDLHHEERTELGEVTRSNLKFDVREVTSQTLQGQSHGNHGYIVAVHGLTSMTSISTTTKENEEWTNTEEWVIESIKSEIDNGIVVDIPPNSDELLTKCDKFNRSDSKSTDYDNNQLEDHVDGDDGSKVNDTKIYICDICGKSHKSLGAFHHHRRRHLVKKKFECDVCSEIYSNKTELKRHIGHHTGERPFKCHLCIKCYRANSELVKHIRIKHMPPCKIVKKYICDICNKCCGSESALTVHSRNHTRPYQCDVCSLGFDEKNSLIEHLNAHFGGAVYKCEVCNNSYSNKKSLSTHMYKHPKYRSYKCNVCENRYFTQSQLKNHVRKYHTGVNPFKCDVCMKTFGCQSKLQRHNRVHTGEKPNKCDVCMKCFFSKQYLEIHMRKHTGEKPFKCEVCTKEFAAQSYIALHMRKHTGEKPYQCDVCLKCFNQRSSFRTHYRMHSNVKENDCKRTAKSKVSKSAKRRNLTNRIDRSKAVKLSEE